MWPNLALAQIGLLTQINILTVKVSCLAVVNKNNVIILHFVHLTYPSIPLSCLPTPLPEGEQYAYGYNYLRVHPSSQMNLTWR